MAEKQDYLRSILPKSEHHTLAVPSSRSDEALKIQYDLTKAFISKMKREGDPDFKDMDVSDMDFKSFMPVAWQILHDPNVLKRKDMLVPEADELLLDYNRPKRITPIEPDEGAIYKDGIWFPVPADVKPPQWDIMIPMFPMFRFEGFFEMARISVWTGLLFTTLSMGMTAMRRYIFSHNATVLGRTMRSRQAFRLFRKFRAARRILPHYLKMGFKRSFKIFMPIPFFWMPQDGTKSWISPGVGGYAAYLNMFVFFQHLPLRTRLLRAALSFVFVGAAWRPLHSHTEDLTMLFNRNIEPYLGRDQMWRRHIRVYESARRRLLPDQRDDVRPDFERLMASRVHLTTFETRQRYQYARGLRMKAGLELDNHDWMLQAQNPAMYGIQPDEFLLDSWAMKERRAHRYSLDIAAASRTPNGRQAENEMELVFMPEPSSQQERPLGRPELLQTDVERVLGTASTKPDPDLYPAPLVPPSLRFFGVPEAYSAELNARVADADLVSRLGAVRGAIDRLGGPPRGRAAEAAEAAIALAASSLEPRRSSWLPW